MTKKIIVDRSKKEDDDGRYHLQSVAPVDDLQVSPWSPGDVEKGDACTQVHILFTPPMDNLIAAYLQHRGVPMVAIRLKSRAVVDSLIAALEEHRDRVWPEDKGESK
jgi:hypothetical protein